MKRILLTLMMMFVPVLAFAASATAVIDGTAEGSKITGKVNFTIVYGGMLVEAKFSHVPPGKHGFHIHENGSCDEMGKAAGGHFNPDHVEHGFMPKDGKMHAHAGDMGNIEIGPDGTGILNIIIPDLKLKWGKYAIIGRSVILHEKADDFSQPTGNAGGRIGCGVIEAVQ